MTTIHINTGQLDMKKTTLTLFALICFRSALALETYSMKCDNGQQFKIAYTGTTAEDSQAIIYSNNNLYLLKIAISASGSRYTGEGMQWWSKGNYGFLSKLRPNEEYASDNGVACKQIKYKKKKK